LWCRYVASIYFARPESTNLKGCEMAMLFSLLNFDSGKPFTVNVAHHIALHFTSVVSGTIKPISMGGLVTCIAKKIYPNFDESNLPKLEGSPPDKPLCFDEPYLTKLHYIERVSNYVYRFPHWNWLLQGRVLCRLPAEEGPERPFKKVVTFKRNRHACLDNSYYTFPNVQVQADRLDAEPTDLGTEDRGMHGVRFIPPTGDYGRFMHKPFDMSPYEPSFLGSGSLPPTFAMPPPFAAPGGWTQDARDSILWGAVNQQHQVNASLLLGQHNLLSHRYNEGFFATDTVHPPHFTPQGPPGYRTWDRQEDNQTDRSASIRRSDDHAASFRRAEDYASGSGSGARRNSSYTGPVDSMYDPFGGY